MYYNFCIYFFCILAGVRCGICCLFVRLLPTNIWQTLFFLVGVCIRMFVCVCVKVLRKDGEWHARFLWGGYNIYQHYNALLSYRYLINLCLWAKLFRHGWMLNVRIRPRVLTASLFARPIVLVSRCLVISGNWSNLWICVWQLKCNWWTSKINKCT